MFDGVSIPFGVPDAIGAAMGFIGLYSTWLLLGLGIVLAVILVCILFWVMEKGKATTYGGRTLEVVHDFDRGVRREIIRENGKVVSESREKITVGRGWLDPDTGEIFHNKW